MHPIKQSLHTHRENQKSLRQLYNEALSEELPKAIKELLDRLR